MKKILLSLLSIIFIISMTTTAYAATGSISSKASAETVIKGKTFTITLTGTSDKPVEGMGTKLEYNTQVLKLKSVVAASGYEKISSGNESDIAISITSGATAKQSATLCTIEFEVLETTSADKATVNFNNSSLVIPDEEDATISRDLACSISSVEVNIKKDDTTVGNQNKEENKVEDKEEVKEEVKKPSNTSGSNNKSNTSSKPSTSTKKNTTNKTTRLPQTGVESFSVIAIIALGAISIASYVSYRKYKNI